jgi:hypothetical protein
MNVKELANKEHISIRAAQKLCERGLIVKASKEIVNDKLVWVIDDDYIRLDGKRGFKRGKK